MKKLLFLLPLLCLAACTHNNGDIGPLFGQWILTEYTVDGQPDPAVVPTEYSFRFQNDILFISRHEQGSHTEMSYYATWSRSGSNVEFFFTHSDTAHPGGYPTPAAIGFDTPGVYHLAILSESPNAICLGHVGPSGTKYEYTLTKHN